MKMEKPFLSIIVPLQINILLNLLLFLDTEQPIRVLGVVLIVLSVIVVSYFLALNAPLLIMKAWEGTVRIFNKYASLLINFMNLE